MGRVTPRREPIVIGGVTVAPGRKATVELPIVRLPTETELSLPLAVLHGARGLAPRRDLRRLRRPPGG
jgi:hypothetical protein